MPFFAALYEKFLATTRRIPLLLVGEKFLFEDAIGRRQFLSCKDFQSWQVGIPPERVLIVAYSSK